MGQLSLQHFTYQLLMKNLKSKVMFRDHTKISFRKFCATLMSKRKLLVRMQSYEDIKIETKRLSGIYFHQERNEPYEKSKTLLLKVKTKGGIKIAPPSMKNLTITKDMQNQQFRLPINKYQQVQYFQMSMLMNADILLMVP